MASAKARTEASEAQATKLEEELRSSKETVCTLNIQVVKKEITREHYVASELENNWANEKTKVIVLKGHLQASTLKVAEAETVKDVAEVATKSAGVQAIEELHKSKDFETELNEGCFDAFQLNFEDCKVTEAFPDLDLSEIIHVEAEGQTTEAENINVAKNLDVELDATDKAVAKAMTKAKSIINKAVKAFNADSTGVSK